MKSLRVYMPDGTEWDIPAVFIAEARTRYYAQKEHFLPGSPDWNDEFGHSMLDYELRDWASYNMDWADVKDVAVRVQKPTHPTVYDREWADAKKLVVG